MVRVIYALCTDTAYQLGFRNKTLRNPAGSNDPDPLDTFILGPQHGAGNIFCSFQIYNFTIILQVIELSGPVRTDRKNVDFVFLDVTELLSGSFFNDDLIGKSGFLYIFNSCH